MRPNIQPFDLQSLMDGDSKREEKFGLGKPATADERWDTMLQSTNQQFRSNLYKMHPEGLDATQK